MRVHAQSTAPRTPSGVPLFSSVLAALIGFCCLLPGLAIATIEDVGVQPIIGLLAVYIALIPILRLRLPTQPLVWAALILAGYGLTSLFSVSLHTSLVFSALQGIYLVLGAIGFSAILCTSEHRRAFVSGYIAGALISSVVSLGQMAYASLTGTVITLANNVNFSIVHAVDRGAAFTPESSALAGLLIPAILCCWFEHEAGIGLLPRWLRGWPALVVLILGLLSTKSTSLFYFPILFLVVAVFQSRSLRSFAVSSARFFIPAVIAGVIFLPLYSSRLVDNAAGSSQAWRMTKIETGLRIFKTYPVTGAGIGMVSDSDFFAPFMKIPPNLRWDTDTRKGVDSTVTRVLAESGLIGFACAYYPIVVFFRRARSLFRSPALAGVGCLSLGLLFSQLALSGYRDQIAFLLPMVAFAIAGNVLGLAVRARPQRRVLVLDPRLSSSGLSHGSTR